MPHPLPLVDADTARDVQMFFARAKRVSDEGVRLQANSGILMLTAAVLAPMGFLDATPTVLAVRIVNADPEVSCDVVVDEVAAADDEAAVLLPETGRAPAWAAIAPPRGGWASATELPASMIAQRAQWGISAVAHGTTSDAGEQAVRSLRAAIWSEPDADLAGLVRGMAFAADAMGFISGEETARVTRSGRWTRLTFRRGHILHCGPSVMGLTAVRATGG